MAVLTGIFRVLVKIRVDPVFRLKRLGFGRVTTLLWDAEYAAGGWDFLDSAKDGRVPVELLEKYAPDGRILDLGCGTTSNLHLRPEAYRHYHGVDLSVKAIERARALGRPNSSYEVADILTYTTTTRYDAILLREVVYYLPEPSIPGLLNRLAGLLEPGGKIIIQIWDTELFGRVVDAVTASGLPMVERLADRHEDKERGAIFVLDGRYAAL